MAYYHVEDIKTTLHKVKTPTLLFWNRLEGRPRAHNFDKAMRAEVRDALWMITKQWQMGEYIGDDAGSPVDARLHISSSEIQTYKAADHTRQPYEAFVPMEVKAEQKKIPFARFNDKAGLDIRLQMGKYWQGLLQKNGLAYKKEFTATFPFELPAKTRETDYIYAHQEVWKTYAAISGRAMDGYSFYESIIAGTTAGDAISVVGADKTALDELGLQFVEWYKTIYYQPEDENSDAWLPSRLEYQFDTTATAEKEEKILTAEEYYHGRLDWYSFDIERKRVADNGVVKKKFTESFVPSQIEFDGMPNTRWWKFEDSKTSFGDIKPSTTDIGKLLLIEFGLVYANDWFMVPYTLPIGSLANVEGLTVTNNFGETVWIKATEEEGVAEQPWSMFKMKSKEQDNTVFLAPAAMKVQESEVLEEIALVRDEMANMVWGIEKTLSLLTGRGDKAAEASLRIKKYHEDVVKLNSMPLSLPYAAPVYYDAMTEVPEQWIPFVPVHVPGSNREVQLQRASMLRIIEGDTESPVKIKPDTSILREGLDSSPQKPYFLHEEEVPRSGVRVSQSFQRTRWINGETYVWLGMSKKTGRGEGSSGLAFDQIENAKKEEQG